MFEGQELVMPKQKGLEFLVAHEPESILKSVRPLRTRRKADTRPYVEAVFPDSYMGEPLPRQEVPQNLLETELLGRINRISKYVNSQVTPEQVKNYLTGLGEVYIDGMNAEPPVDIALRFRNHIVGTVDYIVYHALRQASRIITLDGEGWQERVRENIELADVLYQFFGGDIKKGVFGDMLFDIVYRFVDYSKKRARLFGEQENYVGANRLREGARLLTKEYNIPLPLK